jgi:hypothetical protein
VADWELLIALVPNKKEYHKKEYKRIQVKNPKEEGMVKFRKKRERKNL